MNEIEDITQSIQWMDNDELDQLELQIANRRDDIEREQAPLREYEKCRDTICNWYNNQFGLIHLRLNLAQAGMFAKVEPCSAGYHAGLYKFRSGNSQELAFLDEALSSESEFPDAFSADDEVEAIAKAIAYNMATNQDGLNCWGWEDALNPLGPTPEGGAGPWYRAPVTLHQPASKWSWAWFAEVEQEDEEENLMVLTPVHNEEYAKVLAAMELNHVRNDYPATRPAFDVDDFEVVDWHQARMVLDPNARFSHWA